MAGVRPLVAPIIQPAAAKHTASVIWLHGLGDTGNGWSDVGSQLMLPHARFIYPTAPVIPVTLNGRMKMTAWFDLTSLDEIDNREDAEGIERSAAYVRELVDAEVASGIAPNRIVVAGFSQGGAIALTAALRSPQPLAGAIALSTWLPLAESYPAALAPEATATPVLACHGTQDQVVRMAYGERSAARLRELGFTVDWRTYAMPHSATAQEIADIAEWLAQKLPRT